MVTFNIQIGTQQTLLWRRTYRITPSQSQINSIVYFATGNVDGWMDG